MNFRIYNTVTHEKGGTFPLLLHRKEQNMFLSELKVHAAVLSDEDPDIQTVVRYANSASHM